jgi:CubicO group peptidase (beta-lactamase class C family)
MTKPITSVAALMLVENGRLALTDRLSDYVPGFSTVKVLDDDGTIKIASSHITIRDLFTHTSGLSYGFDPDDRIDKLYNANYQKHLSVEPDSFLDALVNMLSGLPLAHDPGSKFRYSFATDVIAYVVQKVTGTKFRDFLKQNILDPLQMNDTDFYVSAEKHDRVAAVYGPDESGGIKEIKPFEVNPYHQEVTVGAGGFGLFGTAHDYNRFATMLLNKGELDGVRLLKTETVDLMTSNMLPDGVFPWENHSEGFGLGVRVNLESSPAPIPKVAGSYGWGGAANTDWWADPANGITAVLMVQFMPSGMHPVMDEFRSHVYRAFTQYAPISLAYN